MTSDKECLHSYEIKLLVPRTSLSIGIQALADVDADKEFILTLEEIANGSELLDPRDMTWKHSKALQRAFEYVPAMRMGTVTKIPRLLISETPFDFARIGVRPWHTKTAPERVPQVVGRLWYSQLELPSAASTSGPLHSIVRTSPLGSFN